MHVARVGVEFQRRLSDVRAAQRQEEEKAMLDHVKVEAASLAELIYEVKSYAEVDAFIDHFRRPSFRRPILAIIGGSNLRKAC